MKAVQMTSVSQSETRKARLTVFPLETTETALKEFAAQIGLAATEVEQAVAGPDVLVLVESSHHRLM